MRRIELCKYIDFITRLMPHYLLLYSNKTYFFFQKNTKLIRKYYHHNIFLLVILVPLCVYMFGLYLIDMIEDSKMPALDRTLYVITDFVALFSYVGKSSSPSAFNSPLLLTLACHTTLVRQLGLWFVSSYFFIFQ